MELSAPSPPPRPLLRVFLTWYFILTAAAFVANYPGRLNPDTIDMLWQAKNIEAVNDWHSPFVTFLYAFLAPITGSPTGALIVQSALLMTWPAIVTAVIINGRFYYVAKIALLLCWMPVVFVFIAICGQVIKDVLGISFLSVLFFVFTARLYDIVVRTETQFAAWVTISAICATAVRPTNLVILLICTGTMLIFFFRSRRQAQTWINASILLALAAASVAGGDQLFGASKSNSEDPTMVFDLAGISTLTHTDVLGRLADSDAVPSRRPWECYSAKRSDVFFWGDCKEYFGFVARHQDKLHALWFHTMLQHPLAYLTHRWRFAEEFLVLDQPQTIVPPPPLFYFPTINYDGFTKLLPQKMTDQLQIWSPTIAYSPFGLVGHIAFHSWLGRPLLWLSILIAAAIAAYCRRSLVDAPPLALLATLGLSNAIVMILVSPGGELRFLLPTWLCAVGTMVYFGAATLGVTTRLSSFRS